MPLKFYLIVPKMFAFSVSKDKKVKAKAKSSRAVPHLKGIKINNLVD
jgi:hypothetical protein